MGRGIIGTIQLGATLLLAIPVAYFGLQMLLSGRHLVGLAAVVIAILMVAAEEYLTTPGDIPGKAAEKAISGVAKVPEEEEESPEN